MKLKYPDCDFHGYATKANLTCRDKRVIMPDAFKDQDGEKVPLCWGHQHNSVTNVLGHAYLENRASMPMAISMTLTLVVPVRSWSIMAMCVHCPFGQTTLYRMDLMWFTA